jgi:hypothetical protein
MPLNCLRFRQQLQFRVVGLMLLQELIFADDGSPRQS